MQFGDILILCIFKVVMNQETERREAWPRKGRGERGEKKKKEEERKSEVGTRERGRKIDWQYSEVVGTRPPIWRGKGTDELYSQLTPSPTMEFFEFYRSSQFFFLSLH